MFCGLLDILIVRGFCDRDGVAVSKNRLNKDFFCVTQSIFPLTGVLGDKTCLALRGLNILPKSVSSGKRAFLLGDGHSFGDWVCLNLLAFLGLGDERGTGILDLTPGLAKALTI